MSNEALNTARVRKDDEFYTRLEDVEAELKNYKAELKGKRIFLNCDGPQSAFLKYFRERYDEFGLADLKAIGRDTENGEWVLSGLTSSETIPDGDFRNMDSIHFLLDCDVVITNPPFSLFRSWFDTVMSAQKDFIVLCNQNAVTCKNVFPYIKENKVGVGYGHMSCTMEFYRPSHDVKRISSLTWLTTFHTPGKKLTLTESYYADPANYPKYDNYDAIEVSKVSKIPYDYTGLMGVPITFMDNYNPDEFEIVAFRKGTDGKDLVFTVERERELCRTLGCSLSELDKYYPSSTLLPGIIKNAEGKLNGNITYARILIRKNVSNK